MSGGSSDTELNELAVIPTGSPRGPTAVTMVIPVAKQPSASLNSAGSTGVSLGPKRGYLTKGSRLVNARGGVPRAARRLVALDRPGGLP